MFSRFLRIFCGLALVALVSGCVSDKPDEMNPIDADTLAEMGRELYEGMQYTRAVTLYQQALASDPNHLEANLGLGHCFFMLATVAERRGDRKTRNDYDQQAMAYFRRASSIKPDDPRPYLAAGTLKHDARRWQEAIVALKMAVKCAQGDPVTLERCYLYLGDCHIGLAENGQAREHYKEAKEYYMKILELPNPASREYVEKMLVDIEKVLSSGK
jgi:tetratricopeptide (TPR) repeat protein